MIDLGFTDIFIPRRERTVQLDVYAGILPLACSTYHC
jgi:hypothetical protein